MYGLLLTLVLAQAPAAAEPSREASAVVLVERRVGLSPESAQALAGEVSGLLQKRGIPITLAPEQVEPRLSALGEPTESSCEEQRPCLLQRGRALGATLLVLLGAHELAGSLTISLEAVAVQDGTSLWEDVFRAPVGSTQEQGLMAGVDAFAQNLRPKLALPTPPEEEWKPGRAKAAAPSGQRSRTPLYLMGGGTLVAAGAAVTFGLIGLGQKSRLNDARFTDASSGRAASRLTHAEAEKASGRANLFLNVALSSALVSAVLGTTTGYLWLKDDPAP
jgi:hypothetical protein